jgi:hypothetical protein
MDALGGSPSIKKQSVSALINLLEKLDVSDIFRIRNPNKKRYTFRQKNCNNTIIHRRLDYICLSNSLQEYANNTEVLPSMISDHSPVFLSLNDNKDNERGKGTWKFNNSLLQIDSFEEGISSTIRNTLLNSANSNSNLLWAILKYHIQKYCIIFSKKRSKAKNIDKNEHESVVQHFESNPGDVLQSDYDISKVWLENWYEEYTKVPFYVPRRNGTKKVKNLRNISLILRRKIVLQIQFVICILITIITLKFLPRIPKLF